MPRNYRMDPPGRGIDLDANPSLLSGEKLRMAAHHCDRSSEWVCQYDNTLTDQFDLDSPLLSCFLQQRRNIRYQHLYRWVLSIHLPIRLCDLSSFCHQNTEVGTHAAVDETDVGADDSYLFER